MRETDCKEKCVRKTLDGVLHRMMLDEDAYKFYRTLDVKELPLDFILTLPPYSNGIKMIYENDSNITDEVVKIVNLNNDGIKTKIAANIIYEDIKDERAERFSKKGMFGAVTNAYIKQKDNKKFYRQPSLFSKLLVGFANVFLKPLKMKLFFK